MQAVGRVTALLGAAALVALLSGCGAGAPIPSADHSFTLRPVLAENAVTAPETCKQSTPATDTDPGTFAVTTTAGLVQPGETTASPQTLRLCVSVGPAALTKRDIASVTITQDTASATNKREIQVMLTTKGKSTVAGLVDTCTSGQPTCPITLPLGNAPAGQVLPMLDGAPAGCAPVAATALAHRAEDPLVFGCQS